MEKCCETCKWYWEDHSVGASECENTEINEDELDKYYCNGEDGCPHWVARYTEEEMAAEEEYLRKLCEDEENMRRHYEETRRKEQEENK